jgi:hypothetical protein
MDRTALLHALQIEWQKILLYFVGLQVIDITVTWFVSLVTTRETGSFLNALKFYCFKIVLAIVAGIVLLVGMSFIQPQGNVGNTIMLKLAVFAVLIIGNFAILMKIYDCGFLTALAFLFILGVFDSGLGYEARNILGIKPGTQEMAQFRDAMTKIHEQQKVASAQPSPSALPKASTPAPDSFVALPPPPAPRPIPTSVGLIEPVRIPAIINGRLSGQVTLPRGLQVKLINVHDDTLTIQYLETVTAIPRKSTDFPADTH